MEDMSVTTLFISEESAMKQEKLTEFEYVLDKTRKLLAHCLISKKGCTEEEEIILGLNIPQLYKSMMSNGFSERDAAMEIMKYTGPLVKKEDLRKHCGCIICAVKCSGCAEIQRSKLPTPKTEEPSRNESEG